MGARRIRAALLAAGLAMTGAVTIAAAPTAVAEEAPAYELIEVGRPSGFMPMPPVAVDDKGLITGSACCPGPNGGNYQAYAAGPGVPLTKIASTTTAWSNGYDVLDGRVIGSATFGTENHAFSWSVATGLVDLGTPGLMSSARAQNAHGTIVGGAFVPDQWGERPAMWVDGVQQILSPDHGWADAVSDGGHVVGTTGSERAFLWTPTGGYRVLFPDTRSFANDVSASGVVVGSLFDDDFKRHGFVWSEEDGLTTLPAGSTLTEVSDNGVAIGTDSGGPITWTEDGGVQPLEHRGSRWSIATGVNAAGQVLGNARTAVGYGPVVRSVDGSTVELPLPELASASPGGISRNGTVTAMVYGSTGAFYGVWMLPVTDTDGDGVDDDADTCVDVANADQADLDDDGLGDACDGDVDGDGEPNGTDALPTDPTETRDLDGDGVGDNSDPDVDGDGVVNGSDAFPTDGAESADLDGDGTGNNADADDDGDGTPDSSDAFPGDATRDGDEDDNGTPDTPLPVSKDQCAGDGWRGFDNPTFKNAGQCAAKVASKGRK